MIRNGVPVARIFGTELRIHVSLLVVVAAIVALVGMADLPGRSPTWPPAVGWLVAASVGVGFFLSVILHEVAHLALARRAHVAPGAVTILLLGAPAPVESGAARAGEELAIALAGPVVSLVLGFGGMIAVELVAAGLPDVPPVAVTAVLEALSMISVLNAVVGVMNLVPVYPLDGARIVRAAAWAVTHNPSRATRVAASAGRIFGLAVMGLGIILAFSGGVADGILLAALGWVMRGSSVTVGRRAELDMMVQGITVGEVMERELPFIQPQVTLDTFAELIAGPGHVTAIPVMTGDRLLGVVGWRAINRVARGKWGTTRATDVMVLADRLPELDPGDDLRQAVERLQRSGSDGLPVVAEGKLVGLLTRFGVGSALQARLVARRGGGPGTVA